MATPSLSSLDLLNKQIATWQNLLTRAELQTNALQRFCDQVAPTNTERNGIVCQLIFYQMLPVLQIPSQITSVANSIRLVLSPESMQVNILSALSSRADSAIQKLQEAKSVAWTSVVSSLEDPDLASRTAKELARILSSEDTTKDTATSLAVYHLLSKGPENDIIPTMLTRWESYSTSLAEFNNQLRYHLRTSQTSTDPQLKNHIVRYITLLPGMRDDSLLREIIDIQKILKKARSSMPTRDWQTNDEGVDECVIAPKTEETPKETSNLTQLLTSVETIRRQISLSLIDTQQLILNAEKLVFPASQWGFLYDVYDQTKAWVTGTPSTSEQEKQEVLRHALQDLNSRAPSVAH